jgi:hypothetical protein
MNRPSRTFSGITHFYLWISLIAWCGMPLWVLALPGLQTGDDPRLLYSGALVVLLLLATLGFAARRCGSETLSFKDGLLYVVCFMQTGWFYTSLFLVLVAIPIALLGAIGIALLGVIRRDSRERSQHLFHRLLAVFQRNRMVQ